MKSSLNANLYIALLFLTIGLANVFLNGKIILENPFWGMIVFTLIVIGSYNLGIAIAKVSQLKNK